MILGYLVGGFLVIGAMPALIYALTSLVDKVFSVEIFRNMPLKWSVIILLFVIGFIYGIWSIIIQNSVGEGVPVEIGNVEISPKTKHLVVSGPYKNTRNPMLFGTFLAYLAFAFYLNSLTAILIVLAFFVFMLNVVVPMEEKRLAKDFGDEYEDYRSKVPKFIPWFQIKTSK